MLKINRVWQKKKEQKQQNEQKVIKYGFKERVVPKIKAFMSFIIVAFIWTIRIAMAPSLLIVGATWFATRTVPTFAVQVFGMTVLTENSNLLDQFAFFYLPMITLVFIFGLAIVVLMCYTQYRVWTATGRSLKCWYKRAGMSNPFKRKKQEVE